MTLYLKQPIPSPIASMPPDGGSVDSPFEARASSGKPSHMRAKFSIDDPDFAFSVGGSKKKAILYPATGQLPTPGQAERIPVEFKIVPVTSAARRRYDLLYINAELQGYDADGNKTDVWGGKRQPLAPRSSVCTIKLDQVSRALGVADETEPQQALAEMHPVTAALLLVSKSLGVTQRQISDILGVSTTTVAKVLHGKESDKLEAALIRIFKATPSPCPHCGNPRSPCPHCGQ